MAAVAFSAVAFGSAAVADPPEAITPAHTDIVGVGAQTDDLLIDDVASVYDGAIASTTPPVYSFDAYNPSDGSTDNIVTKEGCTPIARPSGANAGITALEANAKPNDDANDYCINYARSSRPRAATDPASILFLPFAIDAVTWAADSQPGVPTNAPKNLSTTALRAIYSCDASILGTGKTGPVTWNEIGGKTKLKVVPVIPPSSSGTRSFFLSEIGVTTLGSCVLGQDNSIAQNEGTDPIFSGSNSANIVVPYSTAVYLAQSIHNHDAGGQGSEVLGSVDKLSSTVGTGSNQKINIKFGYLRNIFSVVRNSSTTGGRTVPSTLVPFFGNGKVGTGYICHLASQNLIASYGFLFDKPDCGTIQ